LIFAFVDRLLCLKVLIYDCSSSFDLDILSLTLLFFLAAHLLKLVDNFLELFERPIVEIITSFFCLEDVLLELLGIVVFLNDLLKEELLFVFLVIH